MNSRAEGIITALATVLLLFTAILDPVITVILVILFIIGALIYRLK